MCDRRTPWGIGKFFIINKHNSNDGVERFEVEISDVIERLKDYAKIEGYECEITPISWYLLINFTKK